MKQSHRYIFLTMLLMGAGLSNPAKADQQLLGHCTLHEEMYGSWGKNADTISIIQDEKENLLFINQDNKTLLKLSAQSAVYYETGPAVEFHQVGIAPLFPVTLLIGMTHQKTTLSFYPERKEFFAHRYIGSIAGESTFDQDFVCGQFDGDLNQAMGLFPRLPRSVNPQIKQPSGEKVTTLTVDGLPVTIGDDDLNRMKKNKKVHWGRSCELSFLGAYHTGQNEEIPVRYEQLWTTANRDHYQKAAKDCLHLRQDWQEKNQVPVVKELSHKLEAVFGTFQRFHQDYTPSGVQMNYQTVDHLVVSEKKNQDENAISTWECRVQYFAQEYITKMSWTITSNKNTAIEMCQHYTLGHLHDYVDGRRDDTTRSIAIVLKQK